MRCSDRWARLRINSAMSLPTARRLIAAGELPQIRVHHAPKISAVVHAKYDALSGQSLDISEQRWSAYPGPQTRVRSGVHDGMPG